MLYKIKIVLLFIILLLNTIDVKSQSSNINLMDLSIIPMVNLEDTNNTDFLFSFKIDHPEDADQLVLKFGTVQDSSDVKYINADITHNAGIDYILYNSKEYGMSGIQARLFFKLNKDEEKDTKVITLYIIDDQSLETSHYYLNF